MTITTTRAGTAPTHSGKTFKWQRVDRLLDLRLDDPVIDRDAQILENLRESYRKNRLRRGYQTALKILPTLYCNYRGPKFPLKQRTGKPVPRWRSLSAWMKVQVGTLVLAEPGYMLFKIHLHDELKAELEASGKKLKDYLRDRISRCAKKQLGGPRWFFFVIEDLSADGEPTRPHAHGSIEIRPAQLPKKGEKGYLHFRRLAANKGQEHAELVYGQLLSKQVLESASGNVKGRRPSIAGGINQTRNVWTTTPKRPFLNDQWVTYAFKNTNEFSQSLGDDRLAFSQSLRTEASKLWKLIKTGESAISQWT